MMGKPLKIQTVAEALKGFGAAMQAVTAPAPRKAVTVNAYPCDPASDDYKIGPVIANNQHGLSNGHRHGTYDEPAVGQRLKAKDIRWEGIPWRVAEDGNGILWVLAPDRAVVETWRPALTRLAEAVVDYGGMDNVLRELLHRTALPPRADGAKPRASNKRLALNAITEAVRDAYAVGATAQDVRLAVLSALGLDSDGAR